LHVLPGLNDGAGKWLAGGGRKPMLGAELAAPAKHIQKIIS